MRFLPSLVGLALSGLCCLSFAQELEETGPPSKIDANELKELKLLKKLSSSLNSPTGLGPAVLTPMATDGSRKYLRLESVVGKAVVVEGFLWGGTDYQSSSPHAGPHVAFDGGAIFIKGIDPKSGMHRGKLVRVSGVLRRASRPISRVPGKTTKLPDYYYVQVERLDLIDAAIDPYLVLHVSK